MDAAQRPQSVEVQLPQDSRSHCLSYMVNVAKAKVAEPADRTGVTKMRRGEGKKGVPFCMFYRDFVKPDSDVGGLLMVSVLSAG